MGDILAFVSWARTTCIAAVLIACSSEPPPSTDGVVDAPPGGQPPSTDGVVDAPPVGQPIALEDFSTARLDAMCRHMVACGKVSSIADCNEYNPPIQVFDNTFGANFQAALDMGKVIYDGDVARRCVEAIAGQTCEFIGGFPRQPDACWAAIRGTVPDGGRCGLDNECVSQQCGTIACGAACCISTCVGGRAPATGQSGDPCSGNSGCGIGLYCAAGSCASQLEANDACSSSSACADGLGCFGSCYVLPELGERCGPLGECREIGATCSLEHCVKFALAGDPCSPDVVCSGFYRCDASSHCSLPPKVPLGAECFGDLCADAGAICVAETDGSHSCKKFVFDGITCDDLHLCASRTGCNAITHKCDPDPVCL